VPAAETRQGRFENAEELNESLSSGDLFRDLSMRVMTAETPMAIP
jgi:hypothetical protein